MSTSDTKLDTALKKHLGLDLAFRSVLWLAISGGAAHLALSSGTAPVEYLGRVSSALAPLVNTLGVIGLLLSVLALLLKDLEATLPPTAQEATRGWLGGFVRRVAGDLSLWTFGALLTMLCVLAIAVAEVDMSMSERAAVMSLGALLLLMTLLTGMASIFVRRAGPTPLVKTVTRPPLLVALYMAVLAILILSLLLAAS
jgi:hypothetical protein